MDRDALVQAGAAGGMAAVIPPRRHRNEPRQVDGLVYKERNLIECCFNNAKPYRRIFSLYEKTDRNYMSILRFIAALLWLR